MIKEFSCKNFRNVNANSIKFERINILIGPNNSGKTNFIKALSFLANMMIRGKDNSFSSSFLEVAADNGWKDLLNKYASNNEVEFNWRFHLNNKDVSYSFAFHTGERIEDFFITKEELDNLDKPSYEAHQFNFFRCHTDKAGIGVISTASKKGVPNKRISISVSNQDSIMMQFKDKLFDDPNLYQDKGLRIDTVSIIEELQQYFKKFCAYSSSQFNLSLIKQPCDAKVKGELLLNDGSNFVNVINHYENTDIYFKSEFDARLRELMPIINLTGITFEFGKLVFRVGYDKKQYTISDLSDGTIKALLLTMLINLPINNELSLLAIDEPEMNLHPAWQRVIGKWIQTSSNYRQCFISTHSPDFLDVFTDGFKNNQVGIFVFDPRSDHLIKKIDYDMIKDDLEDWELGDLYRVNDPVLGGWPW